jgi:hypothetical protein
MEANFPESPTWFNEGLASLFEHTEDSGGHLRGRVNWRLPGLKAAVTQGAALKAVLGEQDMAAIQARWEGFVVKLASP